ncbi:MAG: glycosyl transferase family 1, partial [Rhizobium sp.]
GGLHGAVPIAFEGTETARFVASRKLGLTLDAADAAHLAALLGAMDEKRYLSAFAAVASQDRKQWMIDRAECHGLVQRLASLMRANARTAERQTLPQLHRNRGGLQ